MVIAASIRHNANSIATLHDAIIMEYCVAARGF